MNKFLPLLFLLASCSADEQSFPRNDQAEIVAKLLIKSQCIDPDGVEFIDGNAKSAQFKDSSFVFTGYVRIPNKYSVKITTPYNVGIKFKGGNWQSDTSWTVKFLNLQ